MRAHLRAYRVLFICTGNICRSPAAEGVLRRHIAQSGLAGGVEVRSAGLEGYHIGDAPDFRSIAACRARGYDIAGQRASAFTAEDFVHHDLILAMDSGHFAALRRRKPAQSRAEIALFLPYAGITHTRDIADPYYGTVADFEHMMDLLEEAMPAALRRIEKLHG
jgi:protein-tyrosine phosphatase